ncbi:MAG: hypothetical protein IT427_09020 [Pirellulales bacterium]|nr:hypothetical protein [Pirellulales bacterium]
MSTGGRITTAFPGDVIPVSSYADLDRYLSAFARGALQLVMLLGQPGTGKTQQVKTAAGVSPPTNNGHPGRPRVLYLGGHVSAFGLYQQLWKFRNCPVVIDDLDKLYAQPECVRILKQLCDLTPIKRVTWCSNLTSRATDLPSEFDTTSTVILIANEWRSLNVDIHALEDGALVIHFDPSNDELHEAVRKWFFDHEVNDFIGSLLPYVPRISIRHYLKGKTLRHAGMCDWKATVVRMLLPDATLACVVGPVLNIVSRAEI